MAADGDTLAMTRHEAVLDDAHVGDIQGALGTLGGHDVGPRTSWRARLLALLAVMGPGLIVMVGDNDAGGVATYAQAGQNYGTSLLWVLLLLIPVLIVNQEMVVRLGLVTGVGHARLIFERFGKFWGAFSVGDLFILNFLTIVTEFIGISLAMSHFGVSPYLSVPVAAVLLIGITTTGSFSQWERFMYLFIAANFIAIPLVVLTHPRSGPILHGLVVPQVQGGLTSTSLLLIIGLVGTTVAPWQLFFQQSNVIDKRLTPRWMNYERLDTCMGAFVTIIGAGALLSAAAFAFNGTPLHGHFVDGAVVAKNMARAVSPLAGDLFAIVLLNASIIGAAAVTLSTSYAFGDVFGVRHSLHRGWREAKEFYAIYGGVVALAAAVVLTPGAPLGLLTLAVQALAGVLLPSATVFLLLLCNDAAVLGPWVNAPWLNMIASLIVGLLVILSLILAVTTLFPSVNLGLLLLGLGIGLALILVGTGIVYVRRAGRRVQPGPTSIQERATWRMPPLMELPSTVMSPVQKIGVLSLRAYLVIAGGLMVVKCVELAVGGHV